VRGVEEDDDRRPAFSVPGSVRSRHTTVTGEFVDVLLTVGPALPFQGRWKGSWLVDYSEIDDRDRVWVDDGLPAGAVPAGDGEGWTWVGDPRPYRGTLAHRSAQAAGIHQHYFTVDVAAGMPVGAGDLLVAAVYLDPADPPDEVMLQWRTADGSWEHRAFWGADVIPWGTPGTASRRSLGPFTLAGGLATWDYAGRREALPPSGRITATVAPASVRVGTRTVRINARDSGNGAAVNGRVLLEGQDVAATGQPFTRQYQDPGPLFFDVSAAGYPPASARLTVRDIDDPGN
jgi:hypothetical protein